MPWTRTQHGCNSCKPTRDRDWPTAQHACDDLEHWMRSGGFALTLTGITELDKLFLMVQTVCTSYGLWRDTVEPDEGSDCGRRDNEAKAPDQGAKRPVISWRYHPDSKTNIEVAFGENLRDSERGQYSMFSVTFRRSFKNKEDKWETGMPPTVPMTCSFWPGAWKKPGTGFRSKSKVSRNQNKATVSGSPPISQRWVFSCENKRSHDKAIKPETYENGSLAVVPGSIW